MFRTRCKPVIFEISRQTGANMLTILFTSTFEFFSYDVDFQATFWTKLSNFPVITHIAEKLKEMFMLIFQLEVLFLNSLRETEKSET